MEYSEETLREWLASRKAEVCGHAILDLVANGETARVAMSDGSTVDLSDVSDALNHLREFGWTPSQTAAAKRQSSNERDRTGY